MIKLRHIQDQAGRTLLCCCVPVIQRSYWNSHITLHQPTTSLPIHIDPELVSHSAGLEKEQAPTCPQPAKIHQTITKKIQSLIVCKDKYKCHNKGVLAGFPKAPNRKLKRERKERVMETYMHICISKRAGGSVMERGETKMTGDASL